MLCHRARSAVLVALVALIAGLSLSACDGESSPESSPPTPTITGLADLATDTLVANRGDFCPEVTPDAIEEALGAPPTESDSYANGDRITITPDVTDISHEFGCRWTAADGTEARAWVFAPPVTRARARVLRAGAVDRQGCSAVSDAPAFGSPSVAVRCAGTTTFHGLFGDAWLSCSLDTDALDEVDRWCLSVARAAAA